MNHIVYHYDHPDYCYRVYEGGLWIASARTNHHADEVLTSRALDRIYAAVLARLDDKRPCPSCGDLTSADLCAACVEDVSFSLPLDVEFAPFGF